MPTSATPQALMLLSIFAFFSAVSAKLPKKPCTCSGLPLALYGASRALKPSCLSS